MSHFLTFVCEVSILLLSSIFLSAWLPHLSKIINPNLFGWRLKIHKVWEAMKKDFRTSKPFLVISLIIMCLAMWGLWWSSGQNDIGKIEQLIEAQNTKLDQLIDTLNTLVENGGSINAGTK